MRIARYAVDPTLPGNDRITDLSLAERKEGKVNFTGDVTLLVPQGKANGALLVNFPNRGTAPLGTRLHAEHRGARTAAARARWAGSSLRAGANLVPVA